MIGATLVSCQTQTSNSTDSKNAKNHVMPDAVFDAQFIERKKLFKTNGIMNCFRKDPCAVCLREFLFEVMNSMT